MKLPYNLEIIPGVRQKPNGKLYRIGRYPSGKTVEVPYEETMNAEPARMIPVAEPKPKLNGKKLHTISTGSGKAPFKPFQPRRLHVVEVRWKGNKHVSKSVLPNTEGREWFSNNVMPLSRWTGKEWIPVETVPADYHIQYHVDEEAQ